MTTEIFFLGNVQASRMAQCYNTFTSAANKKSAQYRSITPDRSSAAEDECKTFLEKANIAVVQLVTGANMFHRDSVLAMRGDKPTLFLPDVYLPGFRGLEKVTSRGDPHINGAEILEAEMNRLENANKAILALLHGTLKMDNATRFQKALDEMRNHEALGADVHIADYIAETYHDRLPCHAINHPAPHVLFEMYNQVAKHAGFTPAPKAVSAYDQGRATLPQGHGGLTPYCVEALGLSYGPDPHWFAATNKNAQEIARNWKSTFAETELTQKMTTAQTTLYRPYHDKGVTFLEQPDWTWRMMPAPDVKGHVISAYPSQREKMAREVDQINDTPAQHTVMYNTSTVHVSEGVVDDMVSVHDRQMVMFRKKTPIRNQYSKILADYIAQTQADYGTPPPELPLYTGPMLSDLGSNAQVRIPLIGQHNYFHGIWENLPQLMALQDAQYKGEIIFRSSLPTLNDFTTGFLDLLFPDLTDQIIIERSKRGPEKIPPAISQNFYTGFDWSFYAHLVPGQQVDIGLPAHAAGLDVYNRADTFAFFFSFANGYTIQQKTFRDRAIATVAEMDFSHLPRRFWVSRKGGGRRPEMRGEEALLTELRQYGFEEVQLETLTPAEQIGIFRNADMVATQHGAGMTNIMFAGPQTKVLEIGHGMTIGRWRAFHPLAALAGCRYESFFVDYATEHPDQAPDLKRDGFPVPDCTPAVIDAVMARVAAFS